MVIKMRGNVLVTGASRGIGKAIAGRFAKEHYSVYMTCKNHIEILEQQAREWSACYEVPCIAYQCDMGDVQQVSALMKKLPDIDIVINNAGISYIGLITDMTNEEWMTILNTNLSALFWVCRDAAKGMIKKHQGKIINISSVWGNVGASMEVAYSASKGGINSFTKALAKELGPSNIQVNAVACGMIDTDMNSCFSDEDMEALIQEIPADRIGKPEEVAKLVYMICEGNDYLTGQIITLDGGWT